MKRRHFLTIPAKAAGGVLIYNLQRQPIRLSAQDGTVKIPLRFFTEAQARIVAAASERILPADESGPGATEANVVVYIDRQLAGPYGSDKYRYTKGPWVDSVPEHGYQGKATPAEIMREGVNQLGVKFLELTAVQQDAALTQIERTLFFQLLRTLTIEGMMSDPLHGGNAGMIGWQMIGYPGPLMSFRDDMENYYGRPYRRKPRSLSQLVGRPVKGWEDELN
jgi:gluconate 2-dehydrogenase gamma chain